MSGTKIVRLVQVKNFLLLLAVDSGKQFINQIPTIGIIVAKTALLLVIGNQITTNNWNFGCRLSSVLIQYNLLTSQL